MAFVGVLMLDTQFVRPLGDIGNPQTFAELDIPVQYQMVAGATPERVVRQGDQALLPDFIAAAKGLVAQGATLITTSCGFLVQFQAELEAALPVPVLTSSLLWLPRLKERSAVLTIDANAFTAQYLALAQADPNTPVGGVESGCEFQIGILGNSLNLDLAQAKQDVVNAARQLVAKHPSTECILLECSNMAPYSSAVENATQCRVEHIMSLIENTWKR